jgi:hypothetical protein
MLTRLRTWTLMAGLACLAVTVQAEDREGVARVGGNSQAEGVVRMHGEASETVVRGQCPDYGYCPGGGHGRFWNNGRLACYLNEQAAIYRMRNQAAGGALQAAVAADLAEKGRWGRCKFGYFVPTGCGGAGCPPFGYYSMVYPLDPAHFDQRDGQVYAAQNYNGPVSVPLAPVVYHQYNYGWGVPSSRLTPVAHPAY